MFPIGDENRVTKGVPYVTVGLVIANVLVYLYQARLSLPELSDFVFTFGVIPAEIERGKDLYTLFTSMFVHGGFAHIFGNMLFLWIFGDNIEAAMGRVRYLVFYLACGALASASHIFSNPTSMIPSIGASGAISGVCSTRATGCACCSATGGSSMSRRFCSWASGSSLSSSTA